MNTTTDTVKIDIVRVSIIERRDLECLPIGGLGMVFGPEADVIATLMSAMIDIANEQYNSSN